MAFNPVVSSTNDTKVDHDVKNFPSERIDSLGTAVVTVQRGKLARKRLRKGSGQARIYESGIDQVPEELLKGSTKSVAVKYAPIPEQQSSCLSHLRLTAEPLQIQAWRSDNPVEDDLCDSSPPRTRWRH